MQTALIPNNQARSTWKNWAENVQCQPIAILYPQNEGDVVKIIQQARQEGRKIRVVGSGHSFSPLLDTDQIIVSLDLMQGLISVNEAQCQATVWAGTKLKALGELLFDKGMAQENLGDIDVQSIAGATATGTHGTGAQFGVIATQITAFTIVTGTGDIVECSRTQNPELFEGGRVSLGTWGIITRVTIQLLPTYKLEYTSKRAKLEDTLSRLEEYNATTRNFEFYWMPFTDGLQLRFSNQTDKPVNDGRFKKYINQVVLENNFLKLLCSIGTVFPKSYKRISRVISRAVTTEHKINHSHRVFASLRRVKFREMEYCIPAEHFKEAIRAVHRQVQERDYRVFFPVECRFSKGDDIWLSPAYGRDSAYMAFHVYYKTPHEPYFSEIEKTMMQFDGRPHWGKMHCRNHETLRPAYPKWDQFLQTRAQLDPDQLFINPYMKDVLGL